MVNNDKEVANTMKDTTQTENVLVGTKRLMDTIGRFVADEDLVAVFLRDQRRGWDTVLRLERWPTDQTKPWLLSGGDRLLRLRVEDLGATERYMPLEPRSVRYPWMPIFGDRR